MAYKRISPQPVIEGGTGQITLTNHTVLVGAGTSGITQITAGTTGQVLTGVTGSDPSFQSPAASSISITGDSGGALTGAAFTFTGGTTGLTFAGAGSTETLGGTLVVSNGGTGRATLTNHGVLIGAGTSVITQLGVATNGQILVGVSAADPNFITPTAGSGLSVTTNSTTLSYALSAPVSIANGGTNATSMANTDGVVYYDGTRLVTTAVGTATNVLTSNGAGVAPTFQTIPSSGVTSIAGTANQITASASTGAVTLSIPSAFTAPGSITATTTLTATSGAITATSGDVVITAGDLTLPATTSSSLGIIKMAGNSFIHAYGATADQNTFVGQISGNFTLTSGTATQNTGIGYTTLHALTTGTNNAAVGHNVLPAVTSGQANMGFGQAALQSLTSGSFNSAVGQISLNRLLTGQYNNCFGYATGYGYTGSESSNICIGHDTEGTTGESNVCRIGKATGTGTGQINSTFIAGITGIVVTGNPVLISSGNQLGVAASSQRFKENINDMGHDSSSLLQLRPVTFIWKKDVPGATDEKQFGLIAEEVAQIMPSLVNFDSEGIPFTVKYQEMPAMLLNELKKALKRIEALELKLEGK